MTFDAFIMPLASRDVNAYHRHMARSLQLLDVGGCCTPVTGGVLDAAEAEQLARRFAALGDPTRVRLLSLIAAREGGEACICDLIDPVGLSQPTVSHHMKRLVEAGLVIREQRGRWAFYRVVDTTLATLSEALRPARA
jgi:ArsR family transcriptional regulator